MNAAKKEKFDDQLAATRARDEALLLVAEMEQNLAALRAFVDEEKRAAKRKAPSPKRLARIRLVCEDVTSATRLAGKPVKG